MRRLSHLVRDWRVWVGALAIIPILAFIINLGASQIEQQNGFCASCHTEPESTYQMRFDSAAAPNGAQDLAAFHNKQLTSDKVNIRCIDCHGGEGLAGRTIVLSFAAWDAIKYYTGTARQPAQVVFTVQNEACTKCHEDAIKKVGFDNHFHNKLIEAGAPYERCVDCHISHRAGTEANNFQFRDAILPVCQDCHRKENKGPQNMGLDN